MEFCEDILLEIFSNCDSKTLITCSLVCKYWRQISNSQVLWMKNVLKCWPSQQWLYGKAGVSDLNWIKIYQELFQYSWYSPDQMKYFVTCNSFENELVSPILRKAMFGRMEYISKKWLQVRIIYSASSKVFNISIE